MRLPDYKNSMKHFFFFQDNFLKKVKDNSVLIECKRGFTCNGKLKKFDFQLNIFLKDSILTMKNGESFRETKMLFLRGKIVKYIRIM